MYMMEAEEDPNEFYYPDEIEENSELLRPDIEGKVVGSHGIEDSVFNYVAK